ncbi:hypothetical protein GCM10027590_10830 [Nocardiopsis nanhaiensis]
MPWLPGALPKGFALPTVTGRDTRPVNAPAQWPTGRKAVLFGVRGPQPRMTGRDTARRQRSGAGAGIGRQADAIIGRSPSLSRSGLDHPSPFPDSRPPAVVAKRVKVERH